VGEIEDSGFKPAVPSRPSATARPNGSKESLGTLGGRDQIAHELGRARKPGRATESWKRMQREEGGAEGGGGIYGRSRKQRGPCARAFPDRATAKPGGADRTTEITALGQDYKSWGESQLIQTTETTVKIASSTDGMRLGFLVLVAFVMHHH
jgi:hypothetical protein